MPSPLNLRRLTDRILNLSKRGEHHLERLATRRRCGLTLSMTVALVLGVPFAGTRAQDAGAPQVHIDLAKQSQVIDGFGVNFNGTYFRDSQKPMIDMLIDDLGATIFRLDPYGLSNWEAANDDDDANHMNWAYYDDRYSIPSFEASWAAARYINSRGLMPFLALSGIAPSWMLDRNAPPSKHDRHADLSKPYHLNPAMYNEFAEEVVSMAMYARMKAHISFRYFGPINETDCYPAEGPRIDTEEAPHVLGAIAQRLKKEGMSDVELVVAEQCDLTENYIEPILKTSELMRQVGIFGFHSYGNGSLSPQIQRLKASKYAESARVWLTEYGDLDDLNRSADNEWNNFSLAATRRALRALNEGASAALYWDAYDNYHEHYPRFTYYGLVENSNHLYAPKKRYYAAKQLYHFVRPGARHVASTSDSDGVLVSAFYDAAKGEVVIVGVKQGAPDRVGIQLSGGKVPASWQLYETTRQLDCARAGEAQTVDGSVTLQIPGDAVFTLVGKI